MTLRDDALRMAALKMLIDAAKTEYDALRDAIGPAIIDAGQPVAAVLPDGTRVASIAPAYRGSETMAYVKDRAAFTAWCRENGPDEAVQTTESVAGWYESALLNQVVSADGAPVHPETGQVVDGVQYSTKEATSFVSLRWAPKTATKASGKDLMLAAVRDGAVPILLDAEPAELEAAL